MKNKYYAGLFASALLSFLLLSTHTATAGHGRQGAGDTSTLNVGITFVTPGWYAPGHRIVERPVHYVRDRHGHLVPSPRFHAYKRQQRHMAHVYREHWQKRHHRYHRPNRYHSSYR